MCHCLSSTSDCKLDFTVPCFDPGQDNYLLVLRWMEQLIRPTDPDKTLSPLAELQWVDFRHCDTNCRVPAEYTAPSLLDLDEDPSIDSFDLSTSDLTPLDEYFRHLHCLTYLSIDISCLCIKGPHDEVNPSIVFSNKLSSST